MGLGLAAPWRAPRLARAPPPPHGALVRVRVGLRLMVAVGAWGCLGEGQDGGKGGKVGQRGGLEVRVRAWVR